MKRASSSRASKAPTDPGGPDATSSTFESFARLRRGAAKAFVALSVLCLSGCATYATYQKCGFGGCPGDAAITEDVRALFERHPALEPPNLVNIQTLDRVVYLSGVVDTDLEREMAQAVALQAPGVARVVNSIGLSSGR